MGGERVREVCVFLSSSLFSFPLSLKTDGWTGAVSTCPAARGSFVCWSLLALA